MENRAGSLDLPHGLALNLSVWGHQAWTFLQVLQYVQRKVCWSPAGDVPEMTVIRMERDLQLGFGSNLLWEHP